jgi:putative spermidine/putrescine transport system substrate-binding protein
MTCRRAASRRAALLAAAACVLGASACGGAGQSQGAGKPAPHFVSSAARCDAVRVGPIVRCENFYSGFWPTINTNLDQLYQQAKATNGGRIVVWDWYPVPEVQIAAFTKRFPGLSITTRGLNFNLASAIITAHQTGAQNSDIVKGSLTTMTNLYDQGYWDRVDWSQFGVPKEFLQIGGRDTGLLPDSIQGVSTQYNTSKVSAVPTQIQDFQDPKWRGKLAAMSYDGYPFTGYGMKYGQAKMVELIQRLRSSGNLTVSNDASGLLSSGDKPVLFDTDLVDSNPALQTSPIEHGQTWVQFIGVNKYAANKPGAELFALWQAFDPSWVKQVLMGALPGQVIPYAGLPTATLSQAHGVMGKNMSTLWASIKDDDPTFESWGDRNQLDALLAAANKALS